MRVVRAVELAVVVWHGEGKSLFYVVDVAVPESDQPQVLATFDKRADASDYVRAYKLWAQSTGAQVDIYI